MPQTKSLRLSRGHVFHGDVSILLISFLIFIDNHEYSHLDASVLCAISLYINIVLLHLNKLMVMVIQIARFERLRNLHLHIGLIFHV